MKYQIFAFTLILCGASALETRSVRDKQKDRETVIRSLQSFAHNLDFLIYDQKSNENAMWSPLSAEIPLLLCALASVGSPFDQIIKILNIQRNETPSIGRGFQDLLSELQNPKNVSVNIATKFLVDEAVILKDSFKSLIEEKFFSEISPIIKSDSVIKEINEWVSSKTNGKISNILSTGDLPEELAIVLVNAVYFKGAWKYPFPDKGTRIRNFTDLNGRIHQVPIMYYPKATLFSGDIKNLKAEFAEFPYEEDGYKMVVIMPEYREEMFTAAEFEKLGRQLKTFDYDSLKNLGYKQELSVTLPKFKFKSTIDLKRILNQAGVTDIFNDKSNFTNLLKYPNQQLVVDKVIHKTFIEVNERGTEAGAATAVTPINYSGAGYFFVNRPFYFTILTPYGPLFSGKMLLPKYI